MKKMLLLFALILMIKASAQKTLVIDSLNNDTTYSGQLVKVYISSTGVWDPAYVLTLRLNSVTMVSGTYQTLVDSNFVWSFIVPANTPISKSNITIYNAVSYVYVIYPIATGINELFKKGEFTSVKYYDLSGREINKPDEYYSGVFIERYNGAVSRKVVRIK